MSHNGSKLVFLLMTIWPTTVQLEQENSISNHQIILGIYKIYSDSVFEKFCYNLLGVKNEGINN